MCGKVGESIDYIVSGCSKLAQKEYKRRHDNLGKIVHRKKILREFSIQTDYVIEARRPDLVVVDKKERSYKVIDYAVPEDSRIEEKEKYKIEKYQDLGSELQKIWIC